jgi:hypothetical protein
MLTAIRATFSPNSHDPRSRHTVRPVLMFPLFGILLTNRTLRMTHGPPYNILDRTIAHNRAGCPSLLRRLGRMTSPPRLHVFGHIHEARGALVHQWNPDPNTIPGLRGFSSRSDSSSSGSEQDEDQPDPTSSAVDREGWKETIMVNAANQPAGQNRRFNGMRVPFGGPGFQPIIVDLLDRP